MRMELEEAWEGWMRPVVLILVGGAVVALWYFGVLPDRWAAVALMAGAAVAGAGVVLSRSLREDGSRLRRTLSVTLVVGSLALAAWVPWRVVGPDSLVVRGELAGKDAEIAIPATGKAAAPYVVHIHGEPAPSARNAELLVHLAPGADRPREHKAELTSARMGGVGQRRPQGKDQHDLVWQLKADLSGGATLRAETVGKGRATWPLRVEVRQGCRAAPWLLALGLPMVLLGAWLDGRGPTERPARAGVLAAAALASGLAFPYLFTPAAVTKAVFGTLMIAIVAGGLPAMTLAALVAARSGKKRAVAVDSKGAGR